MIRVCWHPRQFTLHPTRRSATVVCIVDALIGESAHNPWLTPIVAYQLTTLFTEIITNNAAAVEVFPIANDIVEQLGVSPRLLSSPSCSPPAPAS